MTKSLIKVSSLGVVALLTASPAHALISTSIKLGTNLNSYSSTNAAGASVDSFSKMGMGYMGGFGFDFGVGPIGVLADVLYARRSVKFGTGAALLNDTSVAVSSLYVPVQARFSLIPMLSMTAGAFYASTIGQASTYNSSGTKTGSFDVADAAKSDFGLVAGLGVSLPLGVTTLSLEARYNYGLKNIASNPTGDQAQKSRSIDILAGITF